MIYSFILLITLVLGMLGIDVAHNFYTWQSRIKIGRFSDTEIWEKKVLDITVKWLNKTPTIKVTDNERLIIIDILKGNYKRNAIQSWQEASLLLGINEYLKHTNDDKIKKRVNYFIQSKLNNDGTWKEIPKEIDAVILGYAFLKLENFNFNKYKPCFDTLLNLIIELKGEEGTIAYRKHNPNYRYVDTIGFISPFLVRYGLLFNDDQALQLGINQLREFNKYGMLNDLFIPCHTYTISTQIPVGLFGWGRGLGWYATGLIDAWNELPQQHINKHELTQMIVKFAEMALQFQNPNGSWNWLILDKQSRQDSSTTATLAWFFANAASIQSIEKQALESKQKALNYLKQVTRRNGAVDFSQGDTKTIGVHSQQFDTLPFTQGFTLRTISYKK